MSVEDHEKNVELKWVFILNMISFLKNQYGFANSTPFRIITLIHPQFYIRGKYLLTLYWNKKNHKGLSKRQKETWSRWRTFAPDYVCGSFPVDPSGRRSSSGSSSDGNNRGNNNTEEFTYHMPGPILRSSHIYFL